jgi:hypothetical protein
LPTANVLEDALSYNHVELFGAEADRCSHKIHFTEVRRWTMYGDINTIILDVRAKQAL